MDPKLRNGKISSLLYSRNVVGKGEGGSRAGKKLSDPNTRIYPTRKKPGMDNNFMSEFNIRTFGHVRIGNRVRVRVVRICG